MYKLVGEKPNLSQEFTIFVLCYLQRFWWKKCMTWDKWSVVKFCNDCWTFLASMLYVAMQRLDFSWIPMYFYVKKLSPEIFYLFIRYGHQYVVTLLYHFLFWIFLIFSYFFKDVSILYQSRFSYNPRHGRCTPEKPRAIRKD